jgi:hypothetical protein
MAKTAAAKKGSAKRSGTVKQQDRDHGLERVYTRLQPADKARLDKAAAEDHRSTMQYLELLILKHLDQHDKRRK